MAPKHPRIHRFLSTLEELHRDRSPEQESNDQSIQDDFESIAKLGSKGR